MPAGRPPFEITQEVIDLAESYASRGLNQQQIADALGISHETFNNKKNQFVEFAEAIKRGKAKGIALVADALLKNIENANVTAQIFYLKVHAKWKESSVLELTGEDGKPIQTEQTHISAQKRLENELNKVLPNKESEG